MTHLKLPLIPGDEQDVFSRWRHVMCWHTGQKKAIKRRYNKRVRKCLKDDIESQLVDYSNTRYLLLDIQDWFEDDSYLYDL